MVDSAVGRPRPSRPGGWGTAPPKVFTAIPVCRAGQYPGECVRPVLDRNHAGTEIIAAGDGSADSFSDTRRIRRPRPRVQQARMRHCLLVLPGRPSDAGRSTRVARPTCPARAARCRGPDRHCGAPQDARRHRHSTRQLRPLRRGRVHVSGRKGSDTEKARRVLGFEAAASLGESLDEVAEWLRGRGAGSDAGRSANMPASEGEGG